MYSGSGWPPLKPRKIQALLKQPPLPIFPHPLPIFHSQNNPPHHSQAHLNMQQDASSFAKVTNAHKMLTEYQTLFNY